MNFPRYRCTMVLIPALLLAGCAQGGDFPSLAPRAVEKMPLDAPARAPAIVATDAGLNAQIAALIDRARQGQSLFAAALGPAQKAAQGAGPSGSESWIEAQQALSGLEAARAMTVLALADLDALATARAGMPTSAEDQSALTAAQELVSGLAAEQQVQETALRERISDG